MMRIGIVSMVLLAWLLAACEPGALQREPAVSSGAAAPFGRTEQPDGRTARVAGGAIVSLYPSKYGKDALNARRPGIGKL